MVTIRHKAPILLCDVELLLLENQIFSPFNRSFHLSIPSMKRIVETSHAPAPVGPYSQAVWYGDMLFISGQIAIDPPSGDLIMADIETETHQVMKNLGAILKEAGLNYQSVIKASVFVKDMHLYSRINAVYAEYFEESTAPARELVEVANLPKFVNVEISVIAGK